jgi:hypothetical protein
MKTLRILPFVTGSSQKEIFLLLLHRAYKFCYDKVVRLYITGPRDGPDVEEKSRFHGFGEVDSCEIASSQFHCLYIPLVYMTIHAQAEF